MSENKDQIRQTKISKETEKRTHRLNSVNIKRKKLTDSVLNNDKNDKERTNNNIEKVNKSNKNSDRDKNKDKNRIKNLGIIKTFEKDKLFPTEILSNFNKSQKNFMEPDRIQVGPK